MADVNPDDGDDSADMSITDTKVTIDVQSVDEGDVQYSRGEQSITCRTTTELTRTDDQEEDCGPHTSVSSEQLTTEGTHGRTVDVGSGELQEDDQHTSESSCVSHDPAILTTEDCKIADSENEGNKEYSVVGDIFEAAQSGNMAMIENYLDLGVPPDLVDDEGWSVLHHAASHGQVEVIKLLHSRGCSVDPVDRQGRTPLHHAAASGECGSIGVLVELGSNVNHVDNEGNTPLKWSLMCERYAAMEELLKYGGVEDVECSLGSESSDDARRREFVAALDEETLLDLLFRSASIGDVQTVSAILEGGCSVDAVNSAGCTALHRAASGGHVEVVGVLVERGASVDARNSDGRTPLHLAASNGVLVGVSELLRLGMKVSMTVVAGDYGTVLYQTAIKGHEEIVSVLLDAGCPIDVVDNEGCSALHFATRGGAVEVIGVLVERGLDVNKQDNDGRTPLHWASGCGKLEVVRELLRLGATASMTVVAGTVGTPLHQAAIKGHKKIVSVLLDAGCPIDVVDIEGRNALHYTARLRSDDVEVMDVLVERGLDVNKKDKDGLTPLHLAASCDKLEVVGELLRLGAYASMTVVAGKYGTPLHMAAISGQKEIVSVLLDAGCPIDVVSWGDVNILHLVALVGSVEVMEVLCEAMFSSEAQQLAGNEKQENFVDEMRHGSTPSKNPLDCYTPGGHTPAMLAAMVGSVEVLKLLVSKHCDISLRSSCNLSIIEYAILAGQMSKLIDISKVFGVHAENMGELLPALQGKKLLDPSKLLILGSFAGDPLVIDTLSSEESVLTEAAHQNWTTTRHFVVNYYRQIDTEGIYDQLGLSNECFLSPLHISLLLLKYKTEYGCEIRLTVFHNVPEDKLYIEKLISHPLTKFTVNELFPNGLSPLDVAQQFNFHDIACMIERTGGGPGMWADLPKEIKEKGISSLVSQQDLLSYGSRGQEAALRIISHLFGGLPSVTSAEDDAREKILQSKPELRHIVKHVLPRLHHLDCWFDVGILLGVEEDELLTIQSDSKQDRVAYRTMLSTWLKHDRHVTWKCLLDAVGHYEPESMMGEMRGNIAKELTQSQVRKEHGSLHITLQE